MSSPSPNRRNLSGVRSSSPLAFPSSSPQRAAVSSAASNSLAPPTMAALKANNAVRSSSPLAFPSSSPARNANLSAASTPRAAAANNTPVRVGGGAARPLFAPASGGRGAANLTSDGPALPPSSEPLFFPSSPSAGDGKTPATRRRRGDIHSNFLLSPSPLRRTAGNGNAARSDGAPSSSALGAPGSGVPAAPSLSNVGISSDAVEDADRNQGARTVIWNTTVSLDETMTSFKGFLMDFKAKYRTEYARKQGKPVPTFADPEKPVYEH